MEKIYTNFESIVSHVVSREKNRYGKVSPYSDRIRHSRPSRVKVSPYGNRLETYHHRNRIIHRDKLKERRASPFDILPRIR